MSDMRIPVFTGEWPGDINSLSAFNTQLVGSPNWRALGGQILRRSSTQSKLFLPYCKWKEWNGEVWKHGVKEMNEH